MTQKICWLTGGSSGIGFAVAQHLARAGYTVAASARSVEKLNALASENYGTGRIVAYPLDVTDREAVLATSQKIEAELGGIKLAFLCAGNYIPDTLTKFKATDIAAQFELNVVGVANTIEAVLPQLRGKQGAQIAIVASVAGYRGLPLAIGYGGTKAALINMAEAMRFDCAKLGIKIQVICPGFVKTPLTDKNPFPMPFLITVEDAARRIMKGLQSTRFEIVFPTRMAIAMKFLQLLPYGLYYRLIRSATQPK